MFIALAPVIAAAFTPALAQDREFVPAGPIQPLQKGTAAQTTNPGRTVVTSSSMVGEGASIGRSWGSPMIASGRDDNGGSFNHQMLFVNPDREKSAKVRVTCFAGDGKPAGSYKETTVSPLNAVYHPVTTTFNKQGIGEGWCHIQASLPIIAAGYELYSIPGSGEQRGSLNPTRIPYFVLAK